MGVVVFYNDKFDVPVRTGIADGVDKIEIALGEGNSLESRYVANRLFVLGELAAVMVSTNLKELYIPMRLEDSHNEVLAEQWEQFKQGRQSTVIELPEGESYSALSNELKRYKRAGLFIQKTAQGSVAEIVEIEKA